MYAQYVCSDLTSSSSEEFSRVQEESVDKISEISNQPDQTGKTAIHMCRITQITLFVCVIMHLLFLSIRQNPWMQKNLTPPIR